MPVEYTYRCGICNEIITKILYIFSIYKQEVTVNTIKDTAFDNFVKHNMEQIKKNQTLMVCEGCHGVWQYLLNLRVEELDKLKKDFIGYMKRKIKKNKGDVNGNK